MNGSPLGDPAASQGSGPVSRSAAGLGRNVGAWAASLRARRKLWLQVHLWLGLVLGAWLAILGVTGSVLVFWVEIHQALHRDLVRVDRPAAASVARVPLEQVVLTAQRHLPSGWTYGSIAIPDRADGAYVVWYAGEEPTPAPEEATSLNVAIDPHTGEAFARRTFYHAWNPLRHSFVGFFFKLHYAVLLGDPGMTAVGVVCVFLIVSALTGLILWWPLDGKWRRVLTIKRGAGPARLNHDLHQFSGFWLWPVLAALLVSGLYFNLPQQFKWLVECFSPLSPEVTEQAQGPMSAGLDSTLRQLSTGRLTTVTLPNTRTGLMEACYADVPELRPWVVDNRCVVFDPASGRAVHVTDPSRGSGGDTFMQWQWPLHSGQAFGWTGRILVFLCGLACPLLFVTGVIRWLQKRRAQRVRVQLVSTAHRR
ncbi:MAG: hypothetical protein RLZZ524_2006 [Pseudomonadota bacterium]